ncbi:MAG: NAD+ synthase [Deltaproteobacteria bacterium]|nr:MAG: NAD+ synthase [Deltaproteobacteria bacterium]
MRVALGQINTVVGNFAANLAKVRDVVARARGAGAEVVVFPELALSGYPPMDLLERASFLRDQREALDALIPESRDLAIVAGLIMPASKGQAKSIVNAAVALVDGQIAHVQAKSLLPTYDVFDEWRYFQPAESRQLWSYRGRRIGLAICEDVWSGAFWGPERPYALDPVGEHAQAGADVILTVSASPWDQRKIPLREAMLQDAARRHGIPIVFVNLVGGNDGLIFDGASFVVDSAGRVVQRFARFAEDFGTLDPFEDGCAEAEPLEEDIELLERALVLGLRDYLHKLDLSTAVVALSGGLDSSVTAHLAERALGGENVLGILMPGPFSSEHSISDAEALGRNLGIETRSIRIDSIYKAFHEQFAGLFGAAESYGLTQENLQARVRGTLLMAVSNYEGRIVLGTGNKSELSVGYTTLYGDLVGGLAVIGDVLKRDVYRLARHANRDGERVPLHTIKKPPSAELAPGQLDSDSLPPYPVLDEILEQAIEQGRPIDEIQPPPGADAGTVRWVLRQLDLNEYKRRQAPLVLRVSAKAFGSGRRLPIVHRSGWGRQGS